MRFFSQRILGVDSDGPALAADDPLLKKLLAKLTQENTCVEEIARFVESEFKHTISQNEKSYLIIHMNSILAAITK